MVLQGTKYMYCNSKNNPDITITPLEEKAADPRKICGLQYLSGNFLKNAINNVFKGCIRYNNDLANKNETEYRYKILIENILTKKRLYSPSDSLLWCVSNLQDINYALIRNHSEKNNLKNLIKTIIRMFIDFEQF